MFWGWETSPPPFQLSSDPSPAQAEQKVLLPQGKGFRKPFCVKRREQRDRESLEKEAGSPKPGGHNRRYREKSLGP